MLRSTHDISNFVSSGVTLYMKVDKGLPINWIPNNQ